MKTMKPQVGDKFHVEMIGQDYRFNAEVVKIDTDDKDREFIMVVTERYSKDSTKRTYKLNDTMIGVELKWFTDNPRRKITPIQ